MAGSFITLKIKDQDKIWDTIFHGVSSAALHIFCKEKILGNLEIHNA